MRAGWIRPIAIAVMIAGCTATPLPTEQPPQPVRDDRPARWIGCRVRAGSCQDPLSETGLTMP